MQYTLTPKGAIRLAIERSAAAAIQKLDALLLPFSHHLDMQMIDLKYGRYYRAKLIDKIIEEVSRL
jgi:hypothetical protein